MLEDADTSLNIPIIPKITAVIIIAGTVVYSMYLTCLYSSTPAMDAAKFVVSESGEILSPKYAPDIIAPASRGVE